MDILLIFFDISKNKIDLFDKKHIKIKLKNF